MAADYLQIFFGMTGVETQVATALVVGATYYLLANNSTGLGIVLGLGALCRPEFVFIIAGVGGVLLIYQRQRALWTAAIAAVIAAPWVIFATLYYGSPIPHTITAKQIAVNSGFFHAGNDGVLDYFFQFWRYLAPFRQYWAAHETPIPDVALKGIVFVILALAVVGAVYAVHHDRRMLAPLIAVLLFFGYKITFTIQPYFMWYMPPFVALLCLFAGAGLTAISSVSMPLATAAGVLLAAVYAMHLPFTMPLDRGVQQIENTIRTKVGESLNQMMHPEDTAVLEPLGFIGWEARNKTIYDYPGLASPIALAAVKKHQGIPAMVKALTPTFIVLRPTEIDDLRKNVPDTALEYEVVRRFDLDGSVTLSMWGLSYWVIDNHFTILRRRTQ